MFPLSISPAPLGLFSKRRGSGGTRISEEPELGEVHVQFETIPFSSTQNFVLGKKKKKIIDPFKHFCASLGDITSCKYLCLTQEHGLDFYLVHIPGPCVFRVGKANAHS